MFRFLQGKTRSVLLIVIGFFLFCCVSCSQGEREQFPSFRVGETSSAELVWYALYDAVVMASPDGVEVGVLEDGTVLKRSRRLENRYMYHRGSLSKEDSVTYFGLLDDCVPWFRSMEGRRASEGGMDAIYFCDGQNEITFETLHGPETPPEFHRLAVFLQNVSLQNVEIVPVEKYRGFRVLGRGWLAQKK